MSIVFTNNPVETLESIYKAQEEHDRAQEASRAKLVRTNEKVVPQGAEIWNVKADAGYYDSPICPDCGNMDPRFWVDGETEKDLMNGSRRTDDRVSMVEHSRMTCSKYVNCLSCDTVFNYCPREIMFSGVKVMNVGKATPMYLKRILTAQPAKKTNPEEVNSRKRPFEESSSKQA